MVAGHRRKFAGILEGVEEIPCIIRALTDDETTIIMVDSIIRARAYLVIILRFLNFK